MYVMNCSEYLYDAYLVKFIVKTIDHEKETEKAAINTSSDSIKQHL